jgi:F-type H+-transporting ATPase subunit b
MRVNILQLGIGIMGSFLWLAMEASAAASELAEAGEGGGFGLNFDILGTNLINLSIVLVVVVYFGRQFLGAVLNDRRTAIETAIQEAEKRRQTTAAALAEQQQKLAQAQAEAEKIRASAGESAKAVREAILAQAQEDVQRMKEVAAQDLNSARDRIVAELRQRVVAQALGQAESQLQSQVDEARQYQLVDRSIALLGGS